MKSLGFTLILIQLFAALTVVRAQELGEGYLGLPGDNLNLYVVLDLFQSSKTLEDFERSLNDQDTRINNLDLNGDDQVDYLSVSDHVDGISHTIVLQDAIGPNDKQDVAVFTIQKFSDGTVQIQLIGDEALYGKNYIIEPNYDNNGESQEVTYWPVIRFIYNPDYIVWHSLWYWGHYPYYWHRWNPYAWHFYNGYHSHMYAEYYSHYRHWNSPRYTHFNSTYYHGFRAYSPQVNNRISEGKYKATYAHPEMRHDGEAYYSRTHSDRPPAKSSSQLHSSPNTEWGNNRTNGPKIEKTVSFNHNKQTHSGSNGNRITPSNNPVNHGVSHPAPENPASFKHSNPTYTGNNSNRTTPGNNPVNHGLSHPAPENPGFYKHNTQSTPGNNANKITPGNNPVNHGLNHPAPENPGFYKHNTQSSPGNNGKKITPGNNPVNHGLNHPAPDNSGSFHGGSSTHPSPPMIKSNSTFPERRASGPQKNHGSENFNSMKKPSGNINHVNNQAQPQPVKRDSPEKKLNKHK